jgi:hypothetical protein
MYLNGTGGTPADTGQVIHWLTRAAQQHDADAQYYLGMLYRTGRRVGQDLVRAAHWLGRPLGWDMPVPSTTLASCTGWESAWSAISARRHAGTVLPPSAAHAVSAAGKRGSWSRRWFGPDGASAGREVEP